MLLVTELSVQKKILKCHVKDYFKINGKGMIKKPKKGQYARFKNFERKIKSLFMPFVDFQNILVPEDNIRKNPDESYTNKSQEHVPCSYGYRLKCFDDKFTNKRWVSNKRRTIWYPH